MVEVLSLEQVNARGAGLTMWLVGDPNRYIGTFSPRHEAIVLLTIT
jgi:hypothetical protein